MRLFLVTTLFIFVAFAPFTVDAQLTTGNLVPCGNSGQPACQLCQVAQLGNNLLNFAVYAATLVAVIVIVLAGFRYLTAGVNPGAIGSAKSMIIKAVLGLMFVLAAWLIVNTIIRVFVPGANIIPIWQGISCINQPASTNTQYSSGLNLYPVIATPDNLPPDEVEREAQYASEGLYCIRRAESGVCTVVQNYNNGTVIACEGFNTATPNCEATVTNPANPVEGYSGTGLVVGTPPPGATGDILVHDTAAAQFRDAGICVTSTSDAGACYGAGVRETCPQVAPVSSGGATGCTSLNGLRSDTVATVVNLQNSCQAQVNGCRVIVTGGNEPGHQTHQYGYNVDIARGNPQLDQYMQQNILIPANYVGNVPGYGSRYRDSSGNCWLVEGNHYHLDQSCRAR